MKQIQFIIFLFLIGIYLVAAELPFDSAEFKTSKGPLKITFIGHGSLMFNFDNMVIHVDPFSKLTDYKKLPQADLILITHHHGDHLDPAALEPLRTTTTRIICTTLCRPKLTDGEIIANGEHKQVKNISIDAVPAYNIAHKREDGTPFHVKGEGNGYVLTFGDKRVYVAGDTENIPEMKQLKNIDIAFLPMNLPYTMTPEMVKEAVKLFTPKILYIYHFFPEQTDFNALITLFKSVKTTELRIPKQPTE
jgi:L-ascorbate metabolism protein UlaG (beta-lactamase superfamily)